MIGTNGNRESGKSVLAALFDDDDDDYQYDTEMSSTRGSEKYKYIHYILLWSSDKTGGRTTQTTGDR